MNLLLDTCTFLWIALDAPALSPAAREAVLEPANRVYFSVVSAWELAIKYRLGKLPLPMDPWHYIPQLRQRHRIDTLPLHEEAALAVARLPSLHRDPFDRMLVCQAVQESLAIVTPDSLVQQYAVRTLW